MKKLSTLAGYDIAKPSVDRHALERDTNPQSGVPDTATSAYLPRDVQRAMEEISPTQADGDPPNGDAPDGGPPGGDASDGDAPHAVPHHAVPHHALPQYANPRHTELQHSNIQHAEPQVPTPQDPAPQHPEPKDQQLLDPDQDEPESGRQQERELPNISPPWNRAAPSHIQGSSYRGNQDSLSLLPSPDRPIQYVTRQDDDSFNTASERSDRDGGTLGGSDMFLGGNEVDSDMTHQFLSLNGGDELDRTGDVRREDDDSFDAASERSGRDGGTLGDTAMPLSVDEFDSDMSHQSLSSKRSANDELDRGRAVKKPTGGLWGCTELPKDAIFPVLSTRDVDSLRPNRWITGAVLDTLLQGAAFSFPNKTALTSLRLGPIHEGKHDHMLPTAVTTHTGEFYDEVLLCINPNNQHWVSVVLDLRTGKAHVRDSLPDLNSIRKIKSLISSLLKQVNPSVDLSMDVANCPRQDDDCSCGVYALAVSWLVMHRKLIPAIHSIVPSLWRSLFSAMVRGVAFRTVIPRDLLSAADNVEELSDGPGPTGLARVAWLKNQAQVLAAKCTSEYRTRLRYITHVLEVLVPCLSNLQQRVGCEMARLEHLPALLEKEIHSWAATSLNTIQVDQHLRDLVGEQVQTLKNRKKDILHRQRCLDNTARALARLHFLDVQDDLQRSAEQYRAWIDKATG